MKKIPLLLLSALLPFAAWAQSDAEADFFGDAAPATVEAPTTTADPTKQFSEDATGVRWGGTVKSDATWQPAWVGGWPGEASTQWKDSLAYDLSTTLFLDSRPDKDFRFRLSLQTGYPFTNDTTALSTAKYSSTGPSVSTTSTTIFTPHIKVWEMFTDVTLADTLFLRFGKQSASWGTSYFYSPGDVISLSAKDATDPTAQREGPVALKATLPFPGLKANLTGFVLARDSYFGGDIPTMQALGYALQGDMLVGDAQFTLGGFYQKDNAPKAVATLNSGFGFLHVPVLSDVNVFSEAVFSYGADVLKGTGTTSITVPSAGTYTAFAQTSDWEKTVYYTGTVGASYSNSDYNSTLRIEYLYNPFGSNDKDAAQRSYGTVVTSIAQVYGTLGGIKSAGRTYGASDAATPGMHNVTGLLSLAKLGGIDRLSFSSFWQHNISDGSGWVKPMFSLDPWDQLTFSWGIGMVYGDSGTQFPLQFQYYDKNKAPQGTQRVTLYLGVTFGTGKY